MNDWPRRVRQRRSELVVIGNDYLNAQECRPAPNLGYVGDAAIDGHDNLARDCWAISSSIPRLFRP